MLQEDHHLAIWLAALADHGFGTEVQVFAPTAGSCSLSCRPKTSAWFLI